MPHDHIRILNTLFASGTPLHQHINYTINHTTITNSFNTAAQKPEPDYMKQMRRDLIASGRYQI